MTIRTTLSHVARQSQMGGASRATVREFDDDHLMQEVKKADVYSNESPTDFERWQMVGLTSFPIKQEEEEGKKQQSKADKNSQVDWDNDQPGGPAAEALMLYLNGQRSHPVAIVDDRRVRPYEMTEGEGALYAPDGSEQMVLFKENGTYIMSLDNVSVKDKKKKKTRFVSMRHVEKKMQKHKIEKKSGGGGGGGGGSAGAQAATLSLSPETQADGDGGGGAGGQQKEKYKHEGEKVNTEVRCTANRIEFRAGDKVFGYFDKEKETWYFTGKIAQMEFSEKISEKVGSSEVEIKSSSIAVHSEATSLSKKTWIGQEEKGGKEGEKVVTEGGPAKQAWAIPG
jgi:phage gp45-like